MSTDLDPTFTVRVLNFEVLREIEGFRTPQHHAALLDAMDFGDRSGLTDSELAEMCIMSMQDLGAVEAAKLVLKHDFSDRFKAGQITNLAHDMQDEKLWEHYADMSLHERLFNVGSLLHLAFPRTFPEPDAVRVRLEVVATNPDARTILASPLHESFVVRLLAHGMDGRAMLNRLFDESIEGTSFPEADNIVWTIATQAQNADTTAIQVISSGLWLDPLRDADTYSSGAYPDPT